MDEEQIDFTFSQVSVHSLDRLLRDEGYRVQTEYEHKEGWRMIVYQYSAKKNRYEQIHRTLQQDSLKIALKEGLEFIGVEI